MEVTLESSAVYQFADLFDYPLIHGVTTRDLSLPGDGDVNIAGRLPLEDAFGNRRNWSLLLGVDAESLVCGRQVHGNTIQLVDERHRGCGADDIATALPATDGIITRTPRLPLMIFTADCVPVIVYDPVQHALGLAHAGWRGTVANIGGGMVAAMNAAFGSQPADLIVKLGPSIGPCCYEVGDEVISAWLDSGIERAIEAVKPAIPRAHLDLWSANRLAFESAGVRSDKIEHSGLCTRCHADRFFSRRAGQGHRGLFGTIAELKPRADERQHGE